MTVPQFSETNVGLEPLSLSQALRRVTEPEPYVSDFGLWRLGLFKGRGVIHLVLLSRSTKEGLVIPIFPTLRDDYLMEIFYRDKSSNSRMYHFHINTSKLRVLPNSFDPLINDLMNAPSNFKLTSGTYTYNTKHLGTHAPRLWPYKDKGKLEKISLTHDGINPLEPADVEWDIDIVEYGHYISLQYFAYKKYPWFEKHPILKAIFLQPFQRFPVFIVQLQLKNGEVSASAIWLKEDAYTLDEIANKDMTDKKRRELTKS